MNGSHCAGHGPVIHKDEGLLKIKEYIHHRQERERQIQTSLSKLPHNDWISSWDIMRAVYPPLPILTAVSAQWNVTHHLEKMKEEESVEKRWPDLWRLRRRI